MLKHNTKKTKTFAFRLSTQDHTKITKASQIQKRTVSDYVRKCAVDKSEEVLENAN